MARSSDRPSPRKERAPRTESKNGRELGKVRLIFDDGIAINDDPSVTVNLVMHSVEPDNERRIRANTRQYAIKQ